MHAKARTTILLLGAACLILALAAPPSGAQTAVEKVIGMIQQGKCTDATAILDQELKLAPNWGYGHFLYGICLQQQGRNSEAIDRFGLARDYQKDLFAAYYMEASILYTQGECGKVLALIETGLSYASGDEKTEGLRLKGKCCALLKEYDCATEALAEAAGSDCESNYFLGYAFYGKGEWKKAVPPLEKALGTCSGQMKAKTQDLSSKARLNAASGDKAAYCKALKDAEAAMKAGTGNWKTIGEAALGCGKYDTAMKAFGKVLEKKPGDCNANMNLGQALLGAKNYKDADGQLAKAIACLKGPARRNAQIQQGHARMGVATKRWGKYEGEVSPCDTDTAGRKKAMQDFQWVKEPFATAKSEKGIADVDGVVKALENQIVTIEGNIKVREENEKHRIEQLKVWAVEIDLDKKKDKDRDGVPDEEDKCDGTPSPGEPVDLKGCPYKPPCP